MGRLIHRICALDELPDGASRGFEVECDGDVIEGFLVHYCGAVYGYRNQCPHSGANLNWLPDQFLDPDGQLIQCTLHGALFRIADGLCLRGPCVNQALQPLRVEVVKGEVWVSL
jgi:nitrite reductase/ring-hydroxylating ferredoxin subunit